MVMAWVASFLGVAAAVLCANTRFIPSMGGLRPAASGVLIFFGLMGCVAAFSLGRSAWTYAGMAAYALVGIPGVVRWILRRKVRAGEEREWPPETLSPAMGAAPLFLGCAAILGGGGFFLWAYMACAALYVLLDAVRDLTRRPGWDVPGYAAFLLSILLASAEMLLSVAPALPLIP